MKPTIAFLLVSVITFCAAQNVDVAALEPILGAALTFFDSDDTIKLNLSVTGTISHVHAKNFKPPACTFENEIIPDHLRVSYFVCTEMSGYLIPHQLDCKEKEIFSINTRSCQSFPGGGLFSSIIAEQQCPPDVLQIIPNPNKNLLRHYVVCYEDVIAAGICDEGLIFDTVTKECSRVDGVDSKSSSNLPTYSEPSKKEYTYEPETERTLPDMLTSTPSDLTHGTRFWGPKNTGNGAGTTVEHVDESSSNTPKYAEPSQKSYTYEPETGGTLTDLVTSAAPDLTYGTEFWGTKNTGNNAVTIVEHTDENSSNTPKYGEPSQKPYTYEPGTGGTLTDLLTSTVPDLTYGTKFWGTKNTGNDAVTTVEHTDESSSNTPKYGEPSQKPYTYEPETGGTLTDLLTSTVPDLTYGTKFWGTKNTGNDAVTTVEHTDESSSNTPKYGEPSQKPYTYEPETGGTLTDLLTSTVPDLTYGTTFWGTKNTGNDAVTTVEHTDESSSNTPKYGEPSQKPYTYEPETGGTLTDLLTSTVPDLTYGTKFWGTKNTGNDAVTTVEHTDESSSNTPKYGEQSQKPYTYEPETGRTLTDVITSTAADLTYGTKFWGTKNTRNDAVTIVEHTDESSSNTTKYGEPSQKPYTYEPETGGTLTDLLTSTVPDLTYGTKFWGTKNTGNDAVTTVEHTDESSSNTPKYGEPSQKPYTYEPETGGTLTDVTTSTAADLTYGTKFWGTKNTGNDAVTTVEHTDESSSNTPKYGEPSQKAYTYEPETGGTLTDLVTSTVPDLTYGTKFWGTKNTGNDAVTPVEHTDENSSNAPKYGKPSQKPYTYEPETGGTLTDFVTTTAPDLTYGTKFWGTKDTGNDAVNTVEHTDKSSSNTPKYGEPTQKPYTYEPETGDTLTDLAASTASDLTYGTKVWGQKNSSRGVATTEDPLGETSDSYEDVSTTTEIATKEESTSVDGKNSEISGTVKTFQTITEVFTTETSGDNREDKPWVGNNGSRTSLEFPMTTEGFSYTDDLGVSGPTAESQAYTTTAPYDNTDDPGEKVTTEAGETTPNFEERETTINFIKDLIHTIFGTGHTEASTNPTQSDLWNIFETITNNEASSTQSSHSKVTPTATNASEVPLINFTLEYEEDDEEKHSRNPANSPREDNDYQPIFTIGSGESSERCEKATLCEKEGHFRYKYSCNDYYRCYYDEECGQLIQSEVYSCQQCSKFNMHTGKCDLPENVPECSPVRESQMNGNLQCTSTGKYPVPGTCGKYYNCRPRKDNIFLKVRSCPRGMQFSSLQQKCVQDADCQIPRLCKGPGFIGDPNDCSVFYMCYPERSGFKGDRFVCPMGHVFSDKYCLRADVCKDGDCLSTEYLQLPPES